MAIDPHEYDITAIGHKGQAQTPKPAQNPREESEPVSNYDVAAEGYTPRTAFMHPANEALSQFKASRQKAEDHLLHLGTGTMVQKSSPYDHTVPIDDPFEELSQLFEPDKKKKKGGGGKKPKQPKGHGGKGGGGGGKLLGPGALGAFKALPNVPAGATGGPSPFMLVIVVGAVGIGGYLLYHKLHKAHAQEKEMDSKGAVPGGD